MTGHCKRFTEPIGLKVTREQLGCLRRLADQNDKPLAEWCRDRVLQAWNSPLPSPSDHALLAEIAATQDIVVGLICALGREGRLTLQRAQEIVDDAHNRKYRDVAALLKYAESRMRKAAKRSESASDGGFTDEP